MGKGAIKIYTVSQVNSIIKMVLENNLPSQLTIAGEVTNWSAAGSGHCYFGLKDAAAVMPCVMWKSSFRKVRFEPGDGQKVIATGYIDVYEPQGKYQFYVEQLIPAGVGELQLAFEQMRKRLEAEGLFADEYKKGLPAYPERIGILTSESGAAVHDIEDSIRGRWPCAKLFLYAVPVQGEGTAEKIAAAIRDVNRRNKELRLDVLIVGRGGGSLEDLWAFNEEVLARAIFESEIAVISAVGHEVDVTIADLVADARASTPTKAGVIAVPDMDEVLGQLDSFEGRLGSKARWTLDLCKSNLETILANAVFRSPYWAVRNGEQQLDELYISARAAVGEVVNRVKLQLAEQENQLYALNPKAVLGRGYSITTSKKSGRLIKSLKDVKVGEVMVTELAKENLIESKVIKK